MNNEGKKLVMYYLHTAEWWGQAIWFYNKMNGTELPEDIFQVVERVGTLADIPDEYKQHARRVLEYWAENHRLAELVLPRD